MPDRAPRAITFSEAILEGLDLALANDSRVILVGEGVPDPKGIFNTTAGLQEKYGKQRIFDMPLAENGMTGICIGAALCGVRPVMVHQRIDFALLAMDQLINNAAKWHYMFDGKASVPLVVRMIVGRGWGQGPQHSQSLQALFAHIPGLKVVMPSTPRDAKGMLISAIEDDNPVLFIEHRWLHSIKGSVPEEYFCASLDQAEVLHQGADVTVAAFSYTVYESLAVATALASRGIGVEVLNMRSARPLDLDAVLRSVQKTGRLVVVDTASRTGSVAGELVSQVTERGFHALKTAPIRIALPDHPAPTSQYMTEKYYPGPSAIVDAILKAVGVATSSIDYGNLLAALSSDRPHDVPNYDYSGPF